MTAPPLAILKRALGIDYQVGGERHSGWLPPGAATPPPTPARSLTLDVTIEGDESSGYLLIFVAREDPAFGNDYRFDSVSDAEAMAEERFGVGPGQWQDG